MTGASSEISNRGESSKVIRRAIMVIDMVESVRVIEQYGELTIALWRQLLKEIKSDFLPGSIGHLVKSLGDGVMLTFPTVRNALNVGQLIVARLSYLNADAQIVDDSFPGVRLRIGIHVGDFVVDELDIFGNAPNLCARITSLAQPDQIVLSSVARDEITDGINARVVDLGNCFLKHVTEPVHIWGIEPSDLRSESISPDVNSGQVRLAVLPFESNRSAPESQDYGELVSEALIAELGRNPELTLISRLSTRVFRDSGLAANKIGEKLKASLILLGRVHLFGDRLSISYELIDAKSENIIATNRHIGRPAELFEENCGLISEIAASINTQLKKRSCDEVLFRPPQNIQNYSLLVGGIGLMYRSMAGEFDKARLVIDHLSERESRSSAPLSWLAKWYVLKKTRLVGQITENERARAIYFAESAVRRDPNSSFGLAVLGFAQIHLISRPDLALTNIDKAIEKNSSDAFAWLFKAVASSELEALDDSVHASEKALSLSPFDPYRHYFLGLAASANLFFAIKHSDSIKLERARYLADESIRLNASHAPTIRVAINCLVRSGNEAKAKALGSHLLQLQPDFTLSKYLAGSWGSHWIRKESARALAVAGIPSL